MLNGSGIKVFTGARRPCLSPRCVADGPLFAGNSHPELAELIARRYVSFASRLLFSPPTLLRLC